MRILPDRVPLGGGGDHSAEIPTAKKPKVRPPRGLRDKVIFPGRSLPTYTGPYAVGTMEIEVPVSEPRIFTKIRRENRPLLRLETVLMTVYYPAQHDGPHNLSHHDSRISRELWLGRPRLDIAAGYGKFAGVGKLAVPFFLPAMFTKLPAYRNAPLADYWAPPVTAKDREPRAKSRDSPKPEGLGEKPCFPLILFSHGLGGTRTMYSSVCGEFASYGFVVVAVEHRDGSGPRSFVNHARPDDEKAKEKVQENKIDHNKAEERRGYDVVDYCFPRDNPMDTAPNNEKGVDTELRSAQIDLRAAELDEAYKVLCEIVGGDGAKVAERNLRCKGFKGSSTKGLKGVKWDMWKDRVHLHNVTACGHSFGAATVVEILRHDDHYKYVSQGIIYDIWGAGTRAPEKDALHHRIHAPLLAINSEAFTYWPSNFELVSSLVDEAQESPHPSPAWLITLRGTVHISQSDFSLLYPVTSSWFLKMVANPRRALDLNINASLEFLDLVLPDELAAVNRAYQNEKLLESALSPLARIPSMQLHRPDEKYVAMRLRIHHEWVYRISPKLFRQMRRRRYKLQGREYEIGDEVWLHSKPTVDEIKAFRRFKGFSRPLLDDEQQGTENSKTSVQGSAVDRHDYASGSSGGTGSSEESHGQKENGKTT